MTRQEFKDRWESNSKGGGITFDDIAACAKSWGLSASPKTSPIETIRYIVLKSAGTNDCEEFNPSTQDEETVQL